MFTVKRVSGINTVEMQKGAAKKVEQAGIIISAVGNAAEDGAASQLADELFAFLKRYAVPHVGDDGYIKPNAAEQRQNEAAPTGTADQTA